MNRGGEGVRPFEQGASRTFPSARAWRIATTTARRRRSWCRRRACPLASAAGARAFIRYLDDALDARELRTFERVLRSRRDGGAGVALPLMFVYSREDPTVPPQTGPRLHALVPAGEFHWMGETSHFPQVDRPQRLAELLGDFLDGA